MLRLTTILFGIAALVAVAVPAAATQPTTNDVGFWCADQESGIKYEPVEPFVVPPPPVPDTYWSLLVIKAGSTGNSVDEENFVVPFPVVGQTYVWEGTWQGEPISKDISHVILCFEPLQVEETTTTTSTTTTVVPPPTTPPSTIVEATTTTTVARTTTTDPGATTTTVAASTTTSPPPVGAVPAGGGACADGCEPFDWDVPLGVGALLGSLGLLVFGYITAKRRE